MPDGFIKKVETPSAVYIAGRQEWNERYGSYIAQARNWRRAFFGALGCCIVLSAEVAWMAHQSRVEPFVIKQNALGEVAPFGPLPPASEVDPERIRAQLKRWVSDIRTVYSDPYAERAIATEAYSWVKMNSPALDQLNDWFRSNPPNQRGTRESVSVEIESAAPVGSYNTWWVQWTEHHVPKDGSRQYDDHWAISITMEVVKPTTIAALSENPNGVWITEFSLSDRNAK